MDPICEWISSTSKAGGTVPKGALVPDLALAYQLSMCLHCAALNHARDSTQARLMVYLDARRLIVAALQLEDIVNAAESATFAPNSSRDADNEIAQACAITLAVDRWLMRWRRSAIEIDAIDSLGPSEASILRCCWLLGRISISAQYGGDDSLARVAFLSMCLLHDYAPMCARDAKPSAPLNSFTAWSRAYGLLYLAPSNVSVSSFNKASRNALAALAHVRPKRVVDRLWAVVLLVDAAAQRGRTDLYMAFLELFHLVLERSAFDASCVMKLAKHCAHLLQTTFTPVKPRCCNARNGAQQNGQNGQSGHVDQCDDSASMSRSSADELSGQSDTAAATAAAVASSAATPASIVVLRAPKLAEPDQRGFYKQRSPLNAFDRARLLDSHRNGAKSQLHALDSERIANAVPADDFRLWLLSQLALAARTIGDSRTFLDARLAASKARKEAKVGADDRISKAVFNFIDRSVTAPK